MKSIHHRISHMILIALFLPGGHAIAEEKPSDPGMFERAGKSVDEAASWTKEKAQQGWEATKRGAGDAADWTTDKARKGADAVEEGSGKAADTAKEGWETTKETSKSLWQKTKEFFSGDKSE